MSVRYDAVVIGSGFGGAVSACRLAEAGYSVLVLERGRRWDKTTFPRKPGDDWLWDHDHPERCQGWIDFRVFPSMAVVQGAGVGGGSLVYANVSVSARPDTFDVGWPPEITVAALEAHYRAVKRDAGVASGPREPVARAHSAPQARRRANGAADRFEPLDLAVSFSDDWNVGLPDPYSPEHSKPFVNPHGKLQGTCVHLGNCDIGCDVGARNSLDLNYLARAEFRQAEVWPLHIARVIEPLPDGYRVRFERIENGTLVPGEVSARIVVLGAGSLGSTELLLRCRDQFGTLPALSAFHRVMPWFAQGRDAANGILSLRAERLFLDWDIDQSESVINAIVDTHKDFARSTSGLPLVPTTWTVARHLVTPHPLGGCNMGRTSAEGVVNHAGEIFGYPNLYVADGAIVPEALGLNPSKTIAALAERIAAIILEERR